MKRLELYLVAIALLAAILVTSFELSIRLQLNQSASEKLINDMDKRQTATLQAVTDQIQKGLDKSDAIANSAANIGKSAADIGVQNKELLEDIQKLLKDVQTVTQQHSQTIKEVKTSAVRAEQAANTSAANSRKAVRAITHPTPRKKNWLGF
jgi:methyl-accepting chemotaxis protein